jgi:hypothetical protein
LVENTRNDPGAEVVEAELIDSSKTGPVLAPKASISRRSRLVAVVAAIIAVALVMLSVGYSLSYFYPVKRHTYGDGDSSTHEIIVRADTALTDAVYGTGRDRLAIDFAVLSYIDNATVDGQFKSDLYLEQIESLMDTITYSSPKQKYQPIDVTFSELTGDCVAKAALKAYLLHSAGFSFQLVSFRPVDKNGVQQVGHMICLCDLSLQDFINDVDGMVQNYDTNLFNERGQAIDYIALWNVPGD